MCVFFNFYISDKKTGLWKVGEVRLFKYSGTHTLVVIFLYRDSIIFHKCKKVFSLERIFIRGKVSGKIRVRARVCV